MLGNSSNNIIDFTPLPAKSIMKEDVDAAKDHLNHYVTIEGDILNLDRDCVYSQIYFKNRIDTSVTSSLSEYLFLFVILVHSDRYYFLVAVFFIIFL